MKPQTEIKKLQPALALIGSGLVLTRVQRERGSRHGSHQEQSFEVTGQVIDRKTRRGFASLRVEAWENDLIASSITDARGRFHLSLEGGKQPGLFFKLFRLDQLLKSTSDAVIWTAQAGRPDITIEMEMSAPIPASARSAAPHAKRRHTAAGNGAARQRFVGRENDGDGTTPAGVSSPGRLSKNISRHHGGFLRRFPL